MRYNPWREYQDGVKRLTIAEQLGSLPGAPAGIRPATSSTADPDPQFSWKCRWCSYWDPKGVGACEQCGMPRGG